MLCRQKWGGSTYATPQIEEIAAEEELPAEATLEENLPVEVSGDLDAQALAEQEKITYRAYEDGDFIDIDRYDYTYRSTSGFRSKETLTSGWYVLGGGKAGDRITVSGDVKFILLNGADCDFPYGISLHEGSKLSIYAQPEEKGKSVGKLHTEGYGGWSYSYETHIGGAGIGGDFEAANDELDVTCGNLYVYGGILDIWGGEYSAGIGGSGYHDNNSTHVGNGGNVYIYGGDVTAHGGDCAAGIGGGAAAEKAGNGGNTYVYGGVVHAYGGDAGAGIGGGTMIEDNIIRTNSGSGGSGGNTCVYGGTVYAYGGETSSIGTKDKGGGAGIGGGLYGAGGTFTLNGGKVTAKGGKYAAGIGGGWRTEGGTLHLNDGELDVTCSEGTYAIGGGANIKDEGEVDVGGETYVVDLLGGKSVIVNPSFDKDWNEYFHWKDYVHVKIVPVKSFYVPVDYLAYKEAIKDFKLETNYEVVPVVNKDFTLTTWNTGWYVVDSNTTIDEPIRANGNVNLILKDGCKLDANKGILVEAGSSLNIYAQSTAFSTMGKLNASSNTDGVAGIGSGPNKASGNITFYGGYTIANGGKQAAGVGGGSNSAGTVTVYRGTVIGYGGDAKTPDKGSNFGGGAGIGGGYNAAGNVKIYGGSVYGRGGAGGATGIGGGCGTSGGCNVIIYGNATVNGYGGDSVFLPAEVYGTNRMINPGSGIGCGANCSKVGCMVEIRDGRVHAAGGENNYKELIADGVAFKAGSIFVSPRNGITLEVTTDERTPGTIYSNKADIQNAIAGKKEIFVLTNAKDKLISSFTDVKEGAYYSDAVQWAVENNITNGTSATTFSPKDSVTRGQVVTFLWRAAGSPEVDYDMNMTDVAADKWYTEAVRWALSEGITKGTGENVFSPAKVCTRAEIVTLLARFAGVEDTDTETVFSDVSPDAYYAAAVKWAKDNNVTSGTTETTFSPAEVCTRAQAVTFLWRWMNK